MAKKENNILGILAFVSLLLSAICMLIVLINNTGWITIGGQIPNLLQLVSYICLVIVVIMVGWSYASTLSNTWRIIYIVIVVLAVLGVFGFLNVKII